MSPLRSAELRELTTSDRDFDDELIDLLMSHAHLVDALIARRIPPKYRSRMSVEGVRQEVWRAAFRGYSAFKSAGAANFKGWLARLAKRRVIDAFRRFDRQKRGAGALELQQFHGTESSVVDLFSTLAADQPTPSGELTRNEIQQALRNAIARLTPHQRRAISMFHLEGRSQSEIAEFLGMSIPAVKSHLSRGRRRLKEMLSWEQGEAAVSIRQRPDGPRSERVYEEDRQS